MLKTTSLLTETNIQFMLNNGCTVESIIQKCNNLIADPEEEDKKKIKTINNVYLVILEANKIDIWESQKFANLYKNLSIIATKNKHKITCLKKAEELLLEVIKHTAAPQQETEDTDRDLEFVRMLLSKYKNENESSQETHSTFRNFSEKLLLKPCIKSKASSAILNSEKEWVIGIEFDEKCSTLEQHIGQLKPKNVNSASQEIVIVQNNINSLVKIIKICSELLDGLREIESPKAKESELSLQNKSEAVQKSQSPTKKSIPKILSQQSAVLLCDLFAEITQIIKRITVGFEILSISQNRNTLNEKIESAVQKQTQFDRKAKHLMPTLPENDSDISAILETLNKCKEDHLSLIIFIEQKKAQLRMDYSQSSTELLIWSNFFQFTEKNYFLLDNLRKERLLCRLLEGEKKFEMELNEQSEMAFLLTYLSILVQKQPLLQIEEEKEKNSMKIRGCCCKYKDQFQENLLSNKILSNILKSNHKKIGTKEVNTLSAEKALNSTPTLLKEKEKADEFIEKIIQRCHNKSFLEVMIILEEKIASLKSTSLLKLANKISHTFKLICKANLANHNLSPLDLLKVSFLVEKGFFFNSFESYKNKGKVFQDENLFLIKKTEFFNRSILMDSSKKAFTILSKLHGDMKQEVKIENGIKFVYIKGGIKKVSAAASFFYEEDGMTHRETILATPLSGQVFDAKLIDYLNRFRERKGLAGLLYYMEYKTDNQTSLPKQLIIQDREAGDLAEFIQKSDFSKKETWIALLKIIMDIGHGLEYMHAQGVIHWDLKLGNVLYNQYNGLTEGKINDYDTTFDARNGEQPGYLQPAYGSNVYAAPEIDFNTINSQKNTEEQSKRRDMFGFGCMLLDILGLISLLKEGKSIELAANERTIYQKVADQELSEQEFERLIEKLHIGNTMTIEEYLKFAAYNCIHPNHVKRWNIIKFVDELGKFQLKHT